MPGEEMPIFTRTFDFLSWLLPEEVPLRKGGFRGMS